MAVYDKKTKLRFEKDDKEKTMKVTLSVFFDGTSNNMHNSNAFFEYNKKQDFQSKNPGIPKPHPKAWDDTLVDFYTKFTDHDTSSYENDYTNVVRLFKSFNKIKDNPEHIQTCIYVDGIGTGLDFDNVKEYKDWEDLTTAEQHKEYTTDSMGGYAFGWGKTGIVDKVHQACKRAATEIKKQNRGNAKITKLTIDVFGFSRGAAAARTFVGEVTQVERKASSYTYMDSEGSSHSIPIPPHPSMGVVGGSIGRRENHFRTYGHSNGRYL
jgi:hypothetical protein